MDTRTLRRGSWALLLILCVTPGTPAVADEVRKFTDASSGRNSLYGFSASLFDQVGLIGVPAGSLRAGHADLIDVTTGDRLHQLVPSVRRDDDFFGFDLDLRDDFAVVGDPGNPDAETRVAGAAYIFDTATGNQLHRLQPTDSVAGDEFGFGVGVNGSQAVIGAPSGGVGPGAAYLFDLASGVQTRKLLPEDPLAGADFGFDAAIDGNLVLVGAPGNFNTLGLVPGTAYVFDATNGQQLHKLVPSQSAGGDEFGFAVAVSGTTAIIGAPDGGVGEGAAYLFDLTSGTELARLTAADGVSMNDFGSAVDIAGNLAIVGAGGIDEVPGAAYVFDVTTGVQLAKLTPSDLATGDSFGNSVSVFGQQFLVGAPRQDDSTTNAGAAYLFQLSTPVPGDFDEDGSLTVQDIDLLTAEVQAGTHPSRFDVSGDGLVNQVDRTVWVEQLAQTYFGDANLDGQFDSSDLVLVFQGGEYEDDVAGNSSWLTGDWSGDGDFNSSDMVLAFQSGGFEQGPRAMVQAVPEPSSLGLLMLGLLGLGFGFGRRSRRA